MPFNCQKRKTNNFFFSYDSLTIYDGGSSTSPMMGKYCGDSIPPSHVSSSKEIMIHFETKLSNDNGFKMEYNPTGKQTHQFKTTLNLIEIDTYIILGILFISRYF
jgi:hypothetical protein